ncbi:11479_t:CDS:10 [Funneliformis geosporum]|uniref:11479_t:CDS:1 n=1 Tax=Funneliformis geosporum TaxID=1117311 RepID=A0A9W4ST89_9GLOM|nr:11479_t:CDS:10 [Funneliformis geosporum]
MSLNHQSTVYSGPHASISKILLNKTSPLSFIKDILKEFISSEDKFDKEYTFNKGLSIFYMIQYSSYEKLCNDHLWKSDKVKWVRALLNVFENENNFIGFVSLAGLLRKSVGQLISEVELAFLKSIDSLIDQINEDAKQETLTFICAQCIPFVPKVQLKELNSKARLMTLLINIVLENPRLFQNGKFLRDIEQNNNWNESCKVLEEKNNDTLYKELSKISWAISKMTQVVEKNDISSTLTRINEFSINLYKLWDESPALSLASEDSLVMNRSLSEPQIYGDRERMMILSTYSYLYFITSKFSMYGFSVYKNVFFSVLNQIIEINNSNEVISIVKDVESDINVNKPHEKCRVVYYLLIIEQLVKILDDDYLENQILPIFNGLLLRNDDKYIFESANAAYPSNIDVRQLRVAYTTVIKSLSEVDDALAWLCLEILIKKIESISLHKDSHPEFSHHTEGSVDKDFIEKQQSKNQNEAVEREQQDPLYSQQKEEEENLTKAALYLSRGHLLLTLIDQVKSVNLIFMENLLTRIKEFLKEERSNGRKDSVGSGIGLSALQKVLFDVLSNELDYTKKEFGVKWWLSEGSKLFD